MTQKIVLMALLFYADKNFSIFFFVKRIVV